MKKLKFLVLLLAVFWAMTSIALAEGSWQWVASNSEFGTYFDTETLRWDRDGSLNLWVRFFIPILEIME